MEIMKKENKWGKGERWESAWNLDPGTTSWRAFRILYTIYLYGILAEMENPLIYLSITVIWYIYILK